MYGMIPFERSFFDPFDVDGFFGRPQQNFGSFKTDVREEDDKYVLEAELPGFEKDEIKLDIQGKTLTLTAEHSSDTQGGDKTNDENKSEACENAQQKTNKYIRRERSWCSVKRSFDLTGIDTEKIGAEYKNGILYMDLPKKLPEQPQTRRLEIR